MFWSVLDQVTEQASLNIIIKRSIKTNIFRTETRSKFNYRRLFAEILCLSY